MKFFLQTNLRQEITFWYNKPETLKPSQKLMPMQSMHLLYIKHCFQLAS